MATKEQSITKDGHADNSKTLPRSAVIFTRGINDDVAFANASVAVAGDLISGAITPSVGNAVCANLRNVLKVVELKHKFGTPAGSATKRLRLAEV